MGLAQVETIGVSDHPRSVLPTMLHSQKTLIDLWRYINAIRTKDTDKATHSD
jgi:hypothetical protein